MKEKSCVPCSGREEQQNREGAGGQPPCAMPPAVTVVTDVLMQ